ncbi:hypothetical protein [Borrelia duttonii]|uniref:Lipoprotein n=1 Tax=Borrelia duttonii (strain Ly) TaxID=412419 RepID=B5RN84_BORDL|nr:hypothetical protein BDU_1019 [Borrelia duttonii Ly]
MKRKVFIIFILITLINLLLIACGQNGKKPVDPVDNAKVPLKTPVDPVKVQRKSEEEERQERIADIKKNGIPSAVIEMLKDFRKDVGVDKGDFDRYYRSGYIFEGINGVF